MAEPEWDQDTRDLALGYDAVEICPSCGGPAFICQDPAHEFDWHVPEPVRCHRTTALVQAQRGYTEETNPIPAALNWRIVLRAEGSGDG